MKISVITVAYNAASTIGDTMRSVARQSHAEVEHILVDGASTDATVEVARQAGLASLRVISEPDEGIYDGMNKGIRAAGGDLVGFLNADDMFADDSVLERIAGVMQDTALDACYADLVYVRHDDPDAVVRYWKSRDYAPGLAFRGWMPAHPTFYVRREVYSCCGMFDPELKIQADLELTTRLLEVHRIASRYVPEIWVRMRMGGVTNNSLRSMWRGNWESYRALRRHGLKKNPLSYFVTKFAMRIPQYFRRPD